MITTTDYDNKHVFLRNTLIHKKDEPVRCNHLIFFFVKEGEVKVEINYSVYHAKANSMIFISPLDIVTIKDYSNDVQTMVLVVPIALVTNQSNFINFDFEFYEKIKWQVVTTFYGKELRLLNKILDIIQDVHESLDYENFEQSALGCVQMIFQLYHHYFKKNDGYSGGVKGFDSRKKSLFRKFVKELVASHSKSREVLYYANELGVSSGYLNEVCNEVSSYSAKEIIDTAVSSRLKYDLSYTDKSIQELADEYNFPSQSYFSRYYKRLTGLSPSEFRKSRQKGG